MRRGPQPRGALLRLIAFANGIGAVLAMLLAFWLLHFVWRAWTFALVSALLAFAAARMWRAARRRL